MKLAIFIVLTSVLIPTIDYKKQDRVKRSGVVTSINNKEISFAKVVNNSSGMGIITGEDGQFNIRAKKGDTLTITCLGYRDTSIIINNSNKAFIPVAMSETTYQLEEVVVYGLGTYQQFKNKILALKLPPSKEDVLKKRVFSGMTKIKPIYRAPIAGSPNAINSGGAGIGFGKVKESYIQQKEKLYSKGYDKKYQEVRLTTLAERVSKYEGDTLQKFKMFCIVKAKNIERLNEFELVKKVMGLKIIFEQKVLLAKEEQDSTENN
ncbi:MAG: carboxypeptidase-like regulatory domain-containing protein [Bacteroidales bacterium]|jgi:hypothetical protein|nr:carboxypeptidase-like regulatory domain-containing protein [Bacteroidales bacterium]